MNSPAEVRVRRMSAEDVERVLEIAGGLPEAPQWPASAYVTAIDPEYTPRRFALVAKSASEQVVGFVVANVVPPEAELETIAVAIEGQRNGVGGLLLEALTQELRNEQVSSLVLEVRESNVPALGFYRAHGFEQTGQRPRYYTDPEEDAVLLELRLP
jgi:ribosomal-protein-alanine N-acetyltransferase